MGYPAIAAFALFGALLGNGKVGTLLIAVGTLISR
jgi:hypothetical protein